MIMELLAVLNELLFPRGWESLCNPGFGPQEPHLPEDFVAAMIGLHQHPHRKRATIRRYHP